VEYVVSLCAALAAAAVIRVQTLRTVAEHESCSLRLLGFPPKTACPEQSHRLPIVPMSSSRLLVDTFLLSKLLEEVLDFLRKVRHRLGMKIDIPLIRAFSEKGGRTCMTRSFLNTPPTFFPSCLR